ncbi:galactosyldiacylglycerol synthase [Bacillus canaveralius]|uniref:Galactosyldiacylglycerol synthase n=2 Tax=Bacillus canaveralius TaxID=1403243 RepID=A0A2N5GN08_9BACI|nr:galactosyldiacylglycerol synthase [Bacillus canaveralius]PLS00721.1 galactosyldiacylglycerol synthase [Bacillus canaveralius]RSK48610.1 galactosyldiacylglycerol synthase [Bacillus canaveralius]
MACTLFMSGCDSQCRSSTKSGTTASQRTYYRETWRGTMKKILFLPLFKMESGHHKVSSALIDSFTEEYPSIQCKKVDLLSFMSPALEKGISHLYLNWIKKAPAFYSRFYKGFFSQNSKLIQRVYESFCLEKMEELLLREEPDLIVCTHSFSSFLVGKLKKYGVISTPVINIYTDFFINSLWDLNETDWHLVPSRHIKTKFEESGIPSEKIKITGILVNNEIKSRSKRKAFNEQLCILIAGGNLGLLNMSKFDSYSAEYRVLCGTNLPLYRSLKMQKNPDVTPYSYITNSAKMNELYDWADVIVTKPGGVTISEALRKRLPIFLHSVLPGQEEKNVEYLKANDLVFLFDTNLPMEEQIFTFLQNQPAVFKKHKATQAYLSELELSTTAEVCHFIEKTILNEDKPGHITYIDTVFYQLYGNIEN